MSCVKGIFEGLGIIYTGICSFLSISLLMDPDLGEPDNCGSSRIQIRIRNGGGGGGWRKAVLRCEAALGNSPLCAEVRG
jgi:hypothetical protein